MAIKQISFAKERWEEIEALWRSPTQTLLRPGVPRHRNQNSTLPNPFSGNLHAPLEELRARAERSRRRAAAGPALRADMAGVRTWPAWAQEHMFEKAFAVPKQRMWHVRYCSPSLSLSLLRPSTVLSHRTPRQARSTPLSSPRRTPGRSRSMLLSSSRRRPRARSNAAIFVDVDSILSGGDADATRRTPPFFFKT